MDAEPQPKQSNADAEFGLDVRPAMMIGGAKRSRALLAGACLSIAAHLGAAALWLYWPQHSDPGAVSIETEAISVELVPSSVLEASRTPAAPEPEASQDAVAAVEGSTEEAAASAPPPSETTVETNVGEPTPKQEASPPEPSDVAVPRPDFQLDTTASQVAELVEAQIMAEREQEGAREKAHVDRTAPPEVREPATDKKPERKPKSKTTVKRDDQNKEERKEAANSQRGGAASRANQGQGRAAGAVSASAGQVSSYAAQVRARVAANKPPGNGSRGTVVVSFGVATSGGLRHASIARSSGNSSLDQRALSAVRAASPFPPPPAGASSGALSFSIPFHFQ